jgi:hypothetical protein
MAAVSRASPCSRASPTRARSASSGAESLMAASPHATRTSARRSRDWAYRRTECAASSVAGPASRVAQSSIVAIESAPKRKGYWHWVVFDRVDGRPIVWDPARALPDAIRADFRSMKGRHYMLVELVASTAVEESAGACTTFAGPTVRRSQSQRLLCRLRQMFQPVAAQPLEGGTP